jgi:hypothetical protein
MHFIYFFYLVHAFVNKVASFSAQNGNLEVPV